MDNMIWYSSFALPVSASGFARASNLFEHMPELRDILQNVRDSQRPNDFDLYNVSDCC